MDLDVSVWYTIASWHQTEGIRLNRTYDELLHLPHHVSKTRPQMSMQDRAAQFASFAALEGFAEVIRQTQPEAAPPETEKRPGCRASGTAWISNYRFR